MGRGSAVSFDREIERGAPHVVASAAENSGRTVEGMARIVQCLTVFGSILLLARAVPTPPKYTELYIEQVVDHFNYELQDTFMERYFLSGTQRTLSSSD